MPVYRNGRQVGKATSTTWSPVLKKMIALATIDRPHYAEGTSLQFEMTVEAVRHRVGATVVKTPFFNPPRKTATPPSDRSDAEPSTKTTKHHQDHQDERLDLGVLVFLCAWWFHRDSQSLRWNSTMNRSNA